jgi:hypothetical protein
MCIYMIYIYKYPTTLQCKDLGARVVTTLWLFYGWSTVSVWIRQNCEEQRISSKQKDAFCSAGYWYHLVYTLGHFPSDEVAINPGRSLPYSTGMVYSMTQCSLWRPFGFLGFATRYGNPLLLEPMDSGWLRISTCFHYQKHNKSMFWVCISCQQEGDDSKSSQSIPKSWISLDLH